MAPTSMKLSSTPAVYHSALLRAWPPLRPPSANDNAFNDNTGSTQGIRFRISPPPRASSNANHSDVSGAIPPTFCRTSGGGVLRATSVAAGVASVEVSPDGAEIAWSALASGAISSVAGASTAATVLTVPAGIASFTVRVMGG